MDARRNILSCATLSTIAIFGACLTFPLPNWWGINHLSFTSSGIAYLFALGGAILCYLLFGKLPHRSNRAIESIDLIVLGGGWKRRIVAALMGMGVFYLFRSEIHLLGDGYTWLAIFSRGDAYIHKWTEPGSIWLLRQLQVVLGGFDQSTALRAFQILSIISGSIFVYNVLSIVRHSFSKAGTRLLALATLILSGSSLLFLGYVEFYPLLWASIAVFFNFSVRYLRGDRPLWPALVAFAFSVLMHVQAIFFLPAVLYLIYANFAQESWRSAARIAAGVGMVAGAALFFWLYNTRMDFEILILPFFTARPDAPAYTIFSSRHLRDLVNEMFLIVPGVLVLLSLLTAPAFKRPWETTGRFLLIASGGGLLFLVLFGAAITMARDWDIMALSFFAPVLLLFHLLDRAECPISPRQVAIGAFVAGMCSLTFLSVATHTDSAENRFATLLNDRNQNGWVIFANYFYLKGNPDKHAELMGEVRRRFPDYIDLQSGYSFLEMEQPGRAATIAERLVAKNPYDPNFMQLLANVYRKQGKLEDAEVYYTRAMSLKPYHAPLLNELAQLYIKEQKYDQALPLIARAHRLEPEKTFITETMALVNIYLKDYPAALRWADTLFAADSNSPGGHLIKLTVALNRGDEAIARLHYTAFLEFGKGRSDWITIRDYYHYLIQ